MVQPLEITEKAEVEEAPDSHNSMSLRAKMKTLPLAVEGAAPRDRDDNSQSQLPSSRYETVELRFCLCIFLAGILLEVFSIAPRQRPIPYQQLESSGEYAVNQVHNESFEGDTITGNDCRFLFRI